MTPQEIKVFLSKDNPVTIRRVLPKEFVVRHIKQHLRHMQSMMNSFQAILTFPTNARDMPRSMMQQIQKQLTNDLTVNGIKIEDEITNLTEFLKKRQTLQTSIMLNVISETPFPFCMLNTMDYHLYALGHDENATIPCHVILWAQQKRLNDPITVWAQLAPQHSKDQKYLMKQELKSEEHVVRFPSGEANFFAFNTVISVELHDVPTETDALLTGRSLKDMLDEFKRLRKALLRQAGQRGNFLHVVWRTHHPEKTNYIPMGEFESRKTLR